MHVRLSKRLPHGAAAGAAAEMGGVARTGYLPLPARPAARSDARCDAAPPLAEPMAEREVTVLSSESENIGCRGGCAEREQRGQRSLCGCEAAFGRSCVTMCEC